MSTESRVVCNNGVRVRRISATGANADMTSDNGATTVFAVSFNAQVDFIDIESFPTGIEIPSSGHNSSATALTVS